MSAAKYRLTPEASTDIRQILRYAGQHFGRAQCRLYRLLIERAAEMIAEDPTRLGSFDRGDLIAGLRSFHVGLAAPRRSGGSHQTHYITHRMPDDTMDVVILRVLHEGVDAVRHVRNAVPE